MRALCLCLFILCPILCHAGEGRDVRCRFVCLEGVAAPPPLVNVSAKGSEVTCKVPTDTFSKATPCFAKGDVIRFLLFGDLKPAAAATIPAGVDAAILVFAPAEKPDDALPWRIFVAEDFAANFPEGGAKVANFCPQEVRFTINDNVVTLRTGKSHSFARPDNRDEFNMAPVLCQFQQDDTWRTASESFLRFVPGMRYLIFSYVDPATGHPRISTFQDFPAAKTPTRK